MMNSKIMDLLSNLVVELDSLDDGVEAIEAMLDTPFPVRSCWGDFQEMVTSRVSSFFRAAKPYRSVLKPEAWLIGKEVLREHYPCEGVLGEQEAFLDFSKDHLKYRSSIVASLSQGLLERYSVSQKQAAVKSWVNALSWSQKIELATEVRSQLQSENLSVLNELSDFQLALELEELLELLFLGFEQFG